ncbi:MAG: tetratricopeptide repeat protein, partial [Vicinamibacterales bacterium]
HIFVRLGLWQETIDLNLRAADAGAKAMKEHHGDPSYQLHAMDYLAYAYLQQGQESKAREIIAALKDAVGASPETIANFGAFLRGRNALDLHRWSEAAELEVPNRPRRAIEAYRARTIGAVRLGALDAARQNVAGLKQALTAQQTQLRAAGYTVPSDAPIELEESEAWLAFAEGRPEDAIGALRRAADREDADGGESLMVPAREMLAELFLELKRPSEALETYKIALQRAPNRFNSLYGAARTAEMLKAEADAKDYYNRLLGVVTPTADRPEVREAQAFLKIR